MAWIHAVLFFIKKERLFENNLFFNGECDMIKKQTYVLFCGEEIGR